MVTSITKKSFEQEVLRAQAPVLIDFYADWCTPCKMLSPVIEEIAAEHPDMKVCKVNIDNEPELASQFQVMSIPTLVALRDGKVLDTLVGVRPKSDIIDLFAAAR